MHYLCVVLVPADVEDIDIEVDNMLEQYRKTDQRYLTWPRYKFDWYEIKGRYKKPLDKNLPTMVLPFAILTPDNQWIERGCPVRPLIVEDEKSWAQLCADVAGDYLDCHAVACDMHW